MFRFGADATTTGIIRARKEHLTPLRESPRRVLGIAALAAALTIAPAATLLAQSTPAAKPRTVDEVIAAGQALAKRAFGAICVGCDDKPATAARSTKRSTLARRAAGRHVHSRPARMRSAHHRARPHRRSRAIWLAGVDGSEWRCVRVRKRHAWCSLEGWWAAARPLPGGTVRFLW